MSNIGRYLITTADERTWKFDQPAIFLGEWCKLYERKHIWLKMNAIVAEPYGLDLNNKVADNLECRRIEKILFTKLNVYALLRTWSLNSIACILKRSS